MHTNKTSRPLLQASTKCASSPVVTYAKPLNINNKDAKPILIAETQSLLKENKPNRTSSSYTGTEILLPKEDEETAKALVTLLFHIQMRFLRPALLTFFQKNNSNLIGLNETDSLDSFCLLRHLQADETFEKLRRIIDKSKLLSNAKHIDNGLRIIRALNSRNAVAHHDLAKIFRIWPLIFASWTDLIEVTLGNVQTAKDIKSIFFQLSCMSFHGSVNAARVKTVSAMLESTLQSHAIYTALKLNEIQIECSLAMRRQKMASFLLPVADDHCHHDQQQLVTSFIDYENYLYLFSGQIQDPNYCFLFDIKKNDLINTLKYSVHARHRVQHCNSRFVLRDWKQMGDNWIKIGNTIQSIREGELTMLRFLDSPEVRAYELEVEYCKSRIASMEMILKQIEQKYLSGTGLY